MTDDLVKRLRDIQTRKRILGFGGSETLLLFSTEAADLIEAQKAEIERLRARFGKKLSAKARQSLGDLSDSMIAMGDGRALEMLLKWYDKGQKAMEAK